MALDINSPAGLRTLDQERDAVRIFNRHYPDLAYIHTQKVGKDAKAAVDALLLTRGSVVRCVETKCREMTFDTFQIAFRSEWLVTLAKILEGKQVADLLRIPYVGFLYCAQSKILLVQQLYCPIKGWQVKYESRVSETQATVNGGIANRENAYIDMRRAEVLS